MRIFIKNDEGKPSVSVTMVVVSFLVVTIWLVAWIVGVAFGMPVPPFDTMTAMGYLTPLLTLYFGRRYSSKVDQKNGTMEVAIAEVVTTPPGSSINPPA